MHSIKALTIVLALMFTLTACTMTETEQRAASGTLIGAAGGGIIGAIAGNAGMGAAIGAGTGLVGGYLYGKHKEAEQEAYQRGRQDAAKGR